MPAKAASLALQSVFSRVTFDASLGRTCLSS